MIDLNQPLGRDVITTAQVLAAIKPCLRLARALYVGVEVGIEEGWLAGEGTDLTDTGDLMVRGDMRQALTLAAIGAVKSFGAQKQLVYDAIRMGDFIAGVLDAAARDELPEHLSY
jgi:hypothetical protein